MQQYEDDSLDTYTRDKREKSWDLLDDQDQWPNFEKPHEAAICPAENPNDVRFEKSWSLKSPKKTAKDEDDDEDGDPAANDDDEDCNREDDEDGDDEEDDDTDSNGDEDEAFGARVSCLLRALDDHSKALSENINKLHSRFEKSNDKHKEKTQDKAKGSSCRKNTFGVVLKKHPKTKWFEDSTISKKTEQCDQDIELNDEDEFKDTDTSLELEQEKLTDKEQISDQENIKETEEKVAAPDKITTLDKLSSLEDIKSSDINQPDTIADTFSALDQPLLVSPLLKLINNPSVLESDSQNKKDSRQASGFWVPVEKSPDVNINSKTDSRDMYQEYEERLRRLMANRDAIEKNVMKVMATLHE
ncbi:hypothetical protein KR009_008031 [Drosophila setifemur]|nr:hypothetical protein KR009_008031 [Drosophila setifemur]